ncbi:F-box/kelch-repeat protein At3g06240-like [Lolium perenne]|uniref:F-box/kelch-repeat protein At3g06240-like n=1 Tax=Lolium perenne TaxID=4522 RepID=UPI0021F59AE3|nr:putative F-box/kelch-repeat protein At1g13200 [Lolium perenne]
MSHLPCASKKKNHVPHPALSDHVVEEIFARLPAKMVFRLRCLSRAWSATLSSDGFEDLHLRAANLHGGPRIMCMDDDDDYGGTRKGLASSLDRPGGAPFLDAPRIITGYCYPPLITPDMHDHPRYKRAPHLTTQPCRGLVILEAVEARLFHVFNPSTGQIATLPEGRTTGPRTHYGPYYAYFGLGYDAHTCKHKVVRVHYRGRAGRLPLSTGTGCEIYDINSANSEGSWRTVIGAKPTCWIDSYSRSVFMQGHCYWLAHRKLCPREDLILLNFSIRNETFGIVSPPPGLRDDSRYHHSNYDLTELNGRLCIFRQFSRWHEQYDVWLLNRIGSDTDWHLHCRIDLARAFPQLTKFTFMPYNDNEKHGSSMAPLAIVDDGRRILLTEHDTPTAIYAYTTDTGYTESLIDMSFRNVNLAAVYEESIASPGCQPCEEIALISSSSTQALLAILRLLPEHTRANLKLVCRSWRCMVESDIWRCIKHTY